MREEEQPGNTVRYRACQIVVRRISAAHWKKAPTSQAHFFRYGAQEQQLLFVGGGELLAHH